MQYLDETGLNSLWDKIKGKFVADPGGATTTQGLLKRTGANAWAIDTTSYATLDSNGKVPSSQLPSYVDDVLEYANKASFPATGESGKIYVDKATNLTYRWGGTEYVEISASLALGETASTAYRGDRGKTAYDHSQSTHARTDATKVEASTTNGKIKINGTETTVYTHPGSGTNPHGTTAGDVGLGNVGNFKAVSTVASQGLTDTEKSNARANIGAGTSSLTLGTSSTTAYAGDAGKANADAIGVLQSYFTSGVANSAAKLSLSAAVGTTTKPVYFKADGKPYECSSYAGGTKVTLNGTDKGASTASFYAPTAVGTSGQVLSSSGNGAPSWINQGTIAAGTAGKLASAVTLWGVSFDGSANVTTAPNLYIGTTKVQASSANQALAGITTLTTTSHINCGGNVSASGGVSANGFVDLNMTSTGGGGGNVVQIRDWNSYDSTSDEQVLGANLGVELKSGKADKAIGLAAGTAGTSSATSGSSVSIPYVTVNSQGIVTGYGTHTHTLGAAATKGVTDNTSAAAVTSSDTNLITARTLYYAGYIKSVAYNDLTTKPTSEQIQRLVGDYVSKFGTKTGAITLRGGQTGNGSVNLAMSNNELQASIVGLGNLAYASSLAFSSLTNKPTTISGYGISDLELDITSSNSVVTAFELQVGENSVTVGAIPTSVINALS